MAKYIDLNEAAKMLKMDPADLTAIIGKEVFPMKDGASWKFRPDDVERLMRDRGVSEEAEVGDDLLDLDISSADGDDFLSDDLQLELDGDDGDAIELSAEGSDSDSILVSEEELGRSDENTASTIIGEEDDLVLPTSKSGLQEESATVSGVSDLDLGSAKSDSFSLSDVLAGDSGPAIKPAPTAPPKLPAKDAAAGAAKSASSLSDDDLKLASDSGTLNVSLDKGGPAASKPKSGGASLDLDLDDDDLVLGGSGVGSDVTSGAGDSGISLNNPSDSGLSLEEPLQAAGSGIESLELGEDETLSLEDNFSAGGDSLDDDFQLTPTSPQFEDDGDSGSQIIGVEDEEFGSAPQGAFGGIAADGFEMEGSDEGFQSEDEGFAAVPVGVGKSGAAGSEPSDSSYSIWNVLGLFGVVFLLAFSGILLTDLINNMWSWQGPYNVNSSIMDAILGMMP